MTACGRGLWSTSYLVRTQYVEPRVGTGSIVYDPLYNQLSASPCGRWILTTDRGSDHMRCTWRGSKFNGQVIIVKASTGSVLHRYESRQLFRTVQINWTPSGEVCLIQELALVFAVCPATQALEPRAFQELELYGTITAETQCSPDDGFFLSLSPCGSSVIGSSMSAWMDSSSNSLQLWQLPLASSPSSTSRGPPQSHNQIQPEQVEPSICAALITVEPKVWQVAWHPLQGACICAVANLQGGVHLIDARANRCIRTWSEHELHRSLPPFRQDQYTISATPNEKTDKTGSNGQEKTSVDARPKKWYHALRWTQDGHRLAVASRSKCCILHFSDISR